MVYPIITESVFSLNLANITRSPIISSSNIAVLYGLKIQMLILRAVYSISIYFSFLVMWFQLRAVRIAISRQVSRDYKISYSGLKILQKMYRHTNGDRYRIYNCWYMMSKYFSKSKKFCALWDFKISLFLKTRILDRNYI